MFLKRTTSRRTSLQVANQQYSAKLRRSDQKRTVEKLETQLLHSSPQQQIKLIEGRLPSDYKEAIDELLKTTLPKKKPGCPKRKKAYRLHHFTALKHSSQLDLNKIISKEEIAKRIDRSRQRWWQRIKEDNRRIHPRFQPDLSELFSFNDLKLAVLKLSLAADETPNFIKVFQERQERAILVRERIKELEQEFTEDELSRISQFVDKVTGRYKQPMPKKIFYKTVEQIGVHPKYVSFHTSPLLKDPKGRYYTEDDFLLTTMEAMLAADKDVFFFKSPDKNPYDKAKISNALILASLERGVCYYGLLQWKKNIRRLCARIKVDFRDLSRKDKIALIKIASQISLKASRKQNGFRSVHYIYNQWDEKEAKRLLQTKEYLAQVENDKLDRFINAGASCAPPL